jgi:hypothetical protein
MMMLTRRTLGGAGDDHDLVGKPVAIRQCAAQPARLRLRLRLWIPPHYMTCYHCQASAALRSSRHRCECSHTPPAVDRNHLSRIRVGISCLKWGIGNPAVLYCSLILLSVRCCSLP